jgi:AcrR family transcriptional regulator
MPQQPNPTLDGFLAAVAERNAEAAEALSDGRRMRTERGRTAVVEALFELVNEGTHPTVAQIAECAGVSERTVFRYFPDREAMYTAAAIELFPKVAHCLSLFSPDEPFEVRLRRLLELRIELTQIGGKLAQWVEADDKPSELQKTILSLRGEQLRQQISSWLAPELEGENAALLPVINSMLNHWPVGMLLDELPPEECVDRLYRSISQMLRP